MEDTGIHDRATLTLNDIVGNSLRCHLKVGQYVSDPVCMAVDLFDASDGSPYMHATVNLGPDIGNGVIMPKACAFLYTSYGVDIAETFVESGLAKPYVRFGEQVVGCSGFQEYGLYQFDTEMLRNFDPEGYTHYEESYDKAFSTALRQLSDRSCLSEREIHMEDMRAEIAANIGQAEARSIPDGRQSPASKTPCF